MNLYWRNKWNGFEADGKYPEALVKKRMAGEKTASTTAKIIQHFKPKHWAVENGSSSLAFDYVKEFAGLRGFKNGCTYYAYGFKVTKPTILYSNARMSLLSEMNRSPTDKELITLYNKERNQKIRALKIPVFGRNDYRKKSEVPAKLSQHAMSYFERSERFLKTGTLEEPFALE
jgi:hypothetical protein